MQDTPDQTEREGRREAPRIEDNRSDEEKLLDAVCPWRNIEYNIQLEKMNQQSLKVEFEIL